MILKTDYARRLAALTLLTAVGTAARAGAKGSSDLAAERDALLRTDREFSARSEAKGLTDAFLAYMAEGATMLPPGAAPVTGREAIRELLGDGGGVLLTWKPMQAEVAASGELGYTWGTSEWRVPGPGGGMTLARTGKYVSIWKKQKDGTWKFVLDCGNSVAVAPPPAPETSPPPQPPADAKPAPAPPTAPQPPAPPPSSRSSTR
jgi:ketosteroid isomerase-like protein